MRRPRENIPSLSLRAKRSNLTAGTQIIFEKPPRLATLRFAKGKRRPREKKTPLCLCERSKAIPRLEFKSVKKSHAFLRGLQSFL
jgi:hypothetical protein